MSYPRSLAFLLGINNAENHSTNGGTSSKTQLYHLVENIIENLNGVITRFKCMIVNSCFIEPTNNKKYLTVDIQYETESIRVSLKN